MEPLRFSNGEGKDVIDDGSDNQASFENSFSDFDNTINSINENDNDDLSSEHSQREDAGNNVVKVQSQD